MLSLLHILYLNYCLCRGIAGQCREIGVANATTGDVSFDKLFGPVGKLREVVVDQSNFSDSNSEVSVSESVATNRPNLSISGESDQNVGHNKMNMPPPFIDFLGVGAT